MKDTVPSIDFRFLRVTSTRLTMNEIIRSRNFISQNHFRKGNSCLIWASTNVNENAKPPEQPGRQTPTARTAGNNCKRLKSVDDGKSRRAKKKKRRPARHYLVARSIGGKLRQKSPSSSERKSVCSLQRKKRLARKLIKKQTLVERRDSPKPTSKTPSKLPTPVQPLDVANQKVTLGLRTNGANAIKEEEVHRCNYVLRSRVTDSMQTNPLMSSKRQRLQKKREKRNAKRQKLKESEKVESNFQKSITRNRCSQKKAGKNDIRNEPARAMVSGSNEWPSLAEVAGKPSKTGSKDTSQLEDKQVGIHSTRLKRRQTMIWADTVRTKRCKAGANDSLPSTSAAVSATSRVRGRANAMGGFENSEHGKLPITRDKFKCVYVDSGLCEHVGDSSADSDSGSDDDDNNRQKSVKLQTKTGQVPDFTTRNGKGLSKQLTDNINVRSNKTGRVLKKAKDTQVHTVKESNPVNDFVSASSRVNTEGTLFQDKKATSRRSNGDQNWCIDNMSVIYTKPASSIITLIEPKCVSRKRKRRQSSLNICNNRTIYPNTTSQSGLFKHPDPYCSSEDDISTLFSHVSVHSKKPFGKDAPSTSQAVKATCNTAIQQLPKQKNQQEAAKASHADDTTEPKKISARYRALKRSNGCRLDAKALTEHQNRFRLTDNAQSNIVLTRSALRRLRRQKRERNREYSAQRSRQTSARKEPPLKISLSSAGSSEVNVAVTEPEDNKDTKKRKNRDDTNKATNNSVSSEVKRTLSTDLIRTSPVPCSSRDIPIASSDSQFSTISTSTVSDHNFDVDWWTTFLESSDPAACEMVPVDLPGGFTLNECIALLSGTESFRAY